MNATPQSAEKTTTLSTSGKRLHGIIPPLITPLLGRDELDVTGLERFVEHVLKGGVHGLFILGTSGEAPSLSYRLRRELIDRVSRQVKGRVPLLVGVTDTSFVEAVNLARHAADAGAYAVVTAAPFYFPVGQPELIEGITALVGALPLPVFLYNMPQMTKVQFETDTLRHLLQLERIIGVKDSSGDSAYFARLLAVAKARPEWSVLVGPECLLVEAVQNGAQGGVNGGANVWPQLLVQLYEAAISGDAATLARLQPQLATLDGIYRVGRHASAVVKGMKCSLSLLGICNDFMAEPFARFHEPERQQVQAVLRKCGLLE